MRKPSVNQNIGKLPLPCLRFQGILFRVTDSQMSPSIYLPEVSYTRASKRLSFSGNYTACYLFCPYIFLRMCQVRPSLAGTQRTRTRRSLVSDSYGPSCSDASPLARPSPQLRPTVPSPQVVSPRGPRLGGGVGPGTRRGDCEVPPQRPLSSPTRSRGCRSRTVLRELVFVNLADTP